jgi:hypothetical protein
MRTVLQHSVPWTGAAFDPEQNFNGCRVKGKSRAQRPPQPFPSWRERGGLVKAVRTVSHGILIAVVVLVTTAAWAESKGSLGLSAETNVGGKMLPEGVYSLRWEGTGDQIELKIYKGKNMVASVPAHLVQLDAPAASNNALVNTAGGTRWLSQIRFGGKKYAIEIANQGGGSGSAGASK